MRWPWLWPNDVDTQIWPRYGQDVTPYQKWSFYVNSFKSYSLNRQTHRLTDRHYENITSTVYVGGKKSYTFWSVLLLTRSCEKILSQTSSHGTGILLTIVMWRCLEPFLSCYLVKTNDIIYHIFPIWGTCT